MHLCSLWLFKLAAVSVLMVVTAPPAWGRTPASPIAKVALQSPYLNVKTTYTLPLEAKPTLVVMLELGQSLVPMELIRSVRATNQLDGKAMLAVVFVGATKASPTAIEATLEQRGILRAGLDLVSEMQHLVDHDRKLWAALGKPRLPYVVLIAADGSLVGEELFGGAYEVDRERLAACVANRNFKPQQFRSPDVLATHPFYRAAVNAKPLGPVGNRDDHQEAACRIDAKSILQAMLAHDRALAIKTIEAYIDIASNLTVAEAFAKALVNLVGTPEAPQAAAFLRSGATGYVYVSPHRDSAMIQIANPSTQLDMQVLITAKLMSRWDDRPLGQITRTIILQPLSRVVTFDDMFQPLWAGWGDYRAVATVKVTMSSGNYPDVSYRDSLTRTTTHDLLLLPRNEYANVEEAPDGNSDESLRALRAGLGESINGLFLQRLKKDKSTESAGTTLSSAIGDVFSHLFSSSGPPKPALSTKPFPSLKIARWVQGKELCSPVETEGTLTGFGGKVVLLDFMFVNCPPCRAMLPNLSKLHERYKDRGFAVVSVVPTWGSKGLRSLIELKGLTHAFLDLAEGEEKRWGVSAYPTLFLIDRNGDIRATLVAVEPETTLIEKLLDEPQTKK